MGDLLHEVDQGSSGSVGQPLPCTRLRVIIRGKKTAQEWTTGEIEIHCPSQMKGYFGNEDATAQAFTDDGWVCTGDIGYVKNGNWYVIDRTKHLIKVRGWQVSPAEIEATLLEHPDIIDAGVIGVPAQNGCGEVPFAYVIPSVEGTLDQTAIQKFLRIRLARYKNVGAVEFVTTIPRNPTGKILRRILRDSRDHTNLNPAQAAAKEYASAIKYIDQCHKRKRNQEDDGEEQKPSDLDAINRAGPSPAKKALLGMF